MNWEREGGGGTQILKEYKTETKQVRYEHIQANMSFGCFTSSNIVNIVKH